MRLGLSNIALPAYDHLDHLKQLAAIGLQGIEVAPSRVWLDTWKGLSVADVEAYRVAIEAAELEVIGLHSLFFDHPELGLFKSAYARAASLDFLVHLSAVCRDLGGRTMIWGGGRRREAVSVDDAVAEAVNFMGELCRRIEGHGTVVCFEPLGPIDSDFINSAAESLHIVKTVDHPALQIQLDAKALVENDEACVETVKAMAGHLVHFHANEPKLAILGSSGLVDHAALGEMLYAASYGGYVSIEQRMSSAEGCIDDIRRSVRVLRDSYLPRRMKAI